MNAPVQLDSREDAWSIPLDRIDVSNPHLYQDDTWRPYFARLRRQDPVHCVRTGDLWSVSGRSRGTATSWRWTATTR